MSFETALIFFISLLLLWIKPGPGQAYRITRALNDGFRPAFYAAMGTMTGCMVFFVIAVLGLKIITEFFYDIRTVLKILGGVYFIYLGYKGIKNIRSGKWQGRVTQSRTRSFIENYSTGLLMVFSNPFDIAYFLGIMPMLVPVGSFSYTDIFVGLGVMLAAGMIVDLTVLSSVVRVKKALSQTSFVKKLNLVTSIGFILIGLFLLHSIF